MSRLNLPSVPQGRRFEGPTNKDLDQKLTYQQLLNLNHDLSKQNAELRNIGNRLGTYLKSLHSQFQIKPRDENTQLYHAVGTSPVLNQFQATLMPLLDAYENQIQQFEHEFENLHEQFFTLQKKFEEICKQNQQLKNKLTDKTKQLIQVYKNGVNGKMQSDFGHLILDQINDKQKVLVDENALLDREYQTYKSQSQKYKHELQSTKQRLEQTKAKLRQTEIAQRQLQTQVNNLKDSNFDLQIKANEIQAQKRKIEQAHQRAQSQNNHINKQRDMYLTKLEDLRLKVERDTNVPIDNDQSKLIEQLQTQIAFMQAQNGPNDTYKKLTKLQKQYEKIAREKKDLKQAYESMRINEQSLKKQIAQLREKFRQLELTSREQQTNSNRLKKSLQTLTQKSKGDVIRAKKQSRQQLQRLQTELKRKIQLKERKISQLDENLQRVRLERDKLQKQASLYNGRQIKQKTTKDNDRALNKMKDKLKIHEDFFKQQTQIYEHDLKNLRNQYDVVKNDGKAKGQQLKRIRMNYDELKKEYEQVIVSRESLVQEFKSVRDQYQINLKQKERIFEEKIREIKAVVQQSDNKRRQERERVQQASQQYKRALQEIKATYEARIRELQSQASQIHYRTQITPAR